MLETDPRQAIAEAMSLPESLPSATPYWGAMTCPRAEALLQVAQKVSKANPTVVKEALGELRKSVSQASVMTQAKIIDDAASQYVEIGDEDGADKTVKQAVQLAEKLYAKDTDNDDPNRAFKGAGPRPTSGADACKPRRASHRPQLKRSSRAFVTRRSPPLRRFISPRLS